MLIKFKFAVVGTSECIALKLAASTLGNTEDASNISLGSPERQSFLRFRRKVINRRAHACVYALLITKVL